MEIYKALGPISIVQLWLCLAFMVRKWPGNKSMSYSAHAAATRLGIIYYFVVFSVHLFLFYLFVVNWFVPTFHLPKLFSALLIVAMMGQLAALIVPTTGGRKTIIHDITAYIMHMLLMPLCLFIVFSQNFSLFARAFAMLTAIYMVSVWLLLGLKKAKSHHFWLQTAYGLSFHTAILVAVYIR